MAFMHTKQNVDQNPCYAPTKLGTVIWGSSSIETAAACFLNAALHAAEFHIISIPTQVNENQL